MEESDHFVVKWENHPTTLISKMRHLLDEGKFIDVEMNVEGELIKAHRLVLCASSQVFEVRQYLHYSPLAISFDLFALHCY